MAKKSKAPQNLDLNCTSPHTLNTSLEKKIFNIINLVLWLQSYIRFQAYHITV